MKKQFPFSAIYKSPTAGEVNISSTLDFTKEHEFHAQVRDNGVGSPSRLWLGFAKSPLTPDEIRIVDCHSRATQGRTIYILKALDTNPDYLPGTYVGHRFELPEPIAFTSNGNAFMNGFNPTAPGSYISKMHAKLILLNAYSRRA